MSIQPEIRFSPASQEHILKAGAISGKRNCIYKSRCYFLISCASISFKIMMPIVAIAIVALAILSRNPIILGGLCGIALASYINELSSPNHHCQ
jgi:hypothetical protein